MIWGGYPAEIIKVAESDQISIVISEEIVKEINRTLQYQRLREVYEIAGVNRQQLIEMVLQIGKLVQVTSKIRIVEEDPSDDKIIECALASEAEFIVSGDRHLLEVEKHGKTRILSVGEFIKILKAKHLLA
jgi:uncharacterized protein